jgi:hypothetical protein
MTETPDRQAQLGERVAELEDAIEEMLNIWEEALSTRDSKAAGAQMVRIARLVSLRQITDDEDASWGDLRAMSLKRMRHEILAQDAALDTARQMLRDWNPQPLADTLMAMEGDLEAKARLTQAPTLVLDEDATDEQVTKALCGIQKLLLIEKGVVASEEWEAKHRHRLTSEQGKHKCPECGFDLR